MQLTRVLPRRDFIAIIISLGAITLLSWLYLVKMAADMSMPECMSAMQMPVWDAGYFWMMFLMWAVMMVGMMLPSVTPMVLIYAGVARKICRAGDACRANRRFCFRVYRNVAYLQPVCNYSTMGAGSSRSLIPNDGF